MIGTAIIRYKAKMTWTDNRGFHDNIFCNVVHEIRLNDDGTYATVNLDWEPYPEEPKCKTT